MTEARTGGSANPGWIRPPRVYLVALLAGLLGHALWPRPLVPRMVGIVAGTLLVSAAIALFVSAVRTLKAAGTPVPGDEPTVRIVRTGPYRWTRNPIYLAFTVLHLGVALLVDSVALLITLVPAFALMAFIVVPREERYLAAGFGDAYLAYQASVRRWL